jgi:TPR repeat protein
VNFEQTRKLAEKGCDGAQFDLGCFYLDGRGVPQDLVEAVKWFRQSAEQGYSRAQSSMGAMYESGRGVPRDLVEAMNWYRKAADKGNAFAQNSLGVLLANGGVLPQDCVKAVEMFHKSADQGNIEALRNLGRMYRGGQGVVRDYAKSEHFYYEAATLGDADAQLHVGCKYSFSQQHADAVIWFHRAAEQRNANAQLCLGAMYYEGIFFAQDFDEAFKWLDKASKQKALERQWQFILGHISYFRKSTETIMWLRQAAELGHVKAQLCLGSIYYQGKLVPRDFDEVIKWLSKAAFDSHVDAAANWRSICDAKLIMFEIKRQTDQLIPTDSITWRIDDILKRNLRRKAASKVYRNTITLRFVRHMLFKDLKSQALYDGG